MATIVYPVAAFSSGLNVLKRDGRIWKTMNVRWPRNVVNEENAEVLREFIGKSRNHIRSVDLSYFERKFGVHKGLCQICSPHFKNTR